MQTQLEELFRCRYPAAGANKEMQEQFVGSMMQDKSPAEIGVWVFYPWNNKLVHVLDEHEFIEVRTNRNKQKITDNERKLLQQKKIGIVGLSVGQSIALTIAMERVCGELTLADADTLELSNCNRIRTGIYNLGLLKSVLTAREIAEIDPFIKITCMHEGVQEDNIDRFFTDAGKPDLVIEECDSLDIKLLTRIKAKEYGVPLLMDTNDRGMLDIERYDLQPGYVPFHGLLGDVDYHFLKGLTVTEKVPYLVKLIGLGTASRRSKASLIELGSSISNFPQLASSVVLGGAVVTDVARRILLQQLTVSGRFYTDLEDIIREPGNSNDIFEPHQPPPLTYDYLKAVASQLPVANDAIAPSRELVRNMIADAALAPSSGNDQPWKWFCRRNSLTLFHEVNRSYSFGDYNHMASYISLGATLQNLEISAYHYGLYPQIALLPAGKDEQPVAQIHFNKAGDVGSGIEACLRDLYPYIAKRCTNRKIAPRVNISPDVLATLRSAVQCYDGVDVNFVTGSGELKALGEIISAVDRMRILHPHGHHDFFKREIRWSADEAAKTQTGMDVATLEIPPQARMALSVLSDEKTVQVLRDINGAQAFKNISVPNAVTASAIGFITVPDYSAESFIKGGRAVQKQWLKATQLQLACQPMIAPLYLFPRIVFGNGEGLPDFMIHELIELRRRFMEIFPGNEKRGEVFLFRLFYADEIQQRSLRLPLEEILFFEEE